MSARERVVLSLLTGATCPVNCHFMENTQGINQGAFVVAPIPAWSNPLSVTTCAGIWWVRKNDPAMLLPQVYREEYRKTAAARKEQRQTERAFAEQQFFSDEQSKLDEEQQRPQQRRRR